MTRKHSTKNIAQKNALVITLLCAIPGGLSNLAFGAPVLVWGQSNWGEAVWASDNPTDWDGDLVANDVDAFPLDGAASADTDGDGLADDWNPSATDEQIETASLALDNDDDNDGVSDVEELASGNDPLSASDLPAKGLNPAVLQAILKKEN
jgi:hypothetical protein